MSASEECTGRSDRIRMGQVFQGEHCRRNRDPESGDLPDRENEVGPIPDGLFSGFVEGRERL